MLKRIISALSALLFAASVAYAQSTINTGQPATEANLTSLLMREQFTAAAGDIDGLLGMHAATSLGQCPVAPTGATLPVGTDCLVIGSTPYLWYKWTGNAGGWAEVASINPSTGVVSPFLGPSSITASFPVVATPSLGTYALSLVYNSTLALDGSNNLGLNLGHANTFTAAQTFPNNSLTLTEFPTFGASTVLGSIAGGTPIQLTQTQLTSLINLATASLPGAVPAWPNNTTTFFRGDGSYQPLNFAALGGSLSPTQCPTFTSLAIGCVPASGGGTTNFLRADGIFATPSGGGTVTEQKNTAGTGLSTSGNCDNINTNASSPCQYALQTPVSSANGGAGTITGALKGNGAGVVSQAATSDLSDVVAPTSWTPSDQSGASLTFTSVTGLYTRIGKHVVAQFTLTFPSTASGSAASIGGLPVASNSSGANFDAGACKSSIASGFVIGASMAANASTFGIFSPNGNLTNANLTTATITCTLSYISN